MRFRGREDKLYRRRRLLQCFQERIEGILGNLMNFVDDIDFKSAICRLIADILNDLANFIDAAIRRAVNFKNVDRVALSNFFAMAAFVARSSGGPVVTVQRLGQNTRSRCFADSAHAGKKIGVRDTFGPEGVLQRS